MTLARMIAVVAVAALAAVWPLQLRTAPEVAAQPAGGGRTFLMGMGGLQAVNNGRDPLYQINTPMATLAADADIIYLHVETYGLPWNEFAAGPEPPPSHPWTEAMNDLARQREAVGKDVYLAMLLMRGEMAHNAEIRDGALYVNDRWAESCFDFTAWATPGTRANAYRTAYLNYVRWMVGRFRPSYVNVAVEVNSYWENCTNRGRPVAQWNAVVDLVNAAYDLAKGLNGTAVVFPSFAINDMYGHTVVSEQCVRPMPTRECSRRQAAHYSVAYAAVAGLKRDRFAISAWPYAAEVYDRDSPTFNGKRFLTPATIPLDYFTRAADRGRERVFVAETGWTTDDLVIKPRADLTCFAIVPSFQDYQRRYLEVLFTRAQNSIIDAVMWWSNQDALPQDVMTGCYPYSRGPDYAECEGDIWCADANYFRNRRPENPPFGELLFKAYGTTGMKRYDGVIKSQNHAFWQEIFARPYAARVCIACPPTTADRMR
ncbi:MAG: hypothetical protein U0531_04800 [Dehalococcoidia bacterium]